MIYLSRLILNWRSRPVQRDLADCQSLHRAIMVGFPAASTRAAGAREQCGVLYRLDAGADSDRRLMLLVQSRVAPDWTAVPPGWLAETGGDPENPVCKRIDERYRALENGMTLVFRLRANPTRKIDTRSGPDGQRRNGRRVELRDEEGQIGWLRRKGQEGGFDLVKLRAHPDVMDVRVVIGDKVVGKRPSKEQGQVSSQAGRLAFGSVLFDGELRIADAEKFRETLTKGIGPAKAYGFGLLSVALPR